jgi:hypothetical protein
MALRHLTEQHRPEQTVPYIFKHFIDMLYDTPGPGDCTIKLFMAIIFEIIISLREFALSVTSTLI